jgi:hypothetical protein
MVHPPDLLKTGVVKFKTSLKRSQQCFNMLKWSLSQQSLEEQIKWRREDLLSSWYLIAIRQCRGNRKRASHLMLDLTQKSSVMVTKLDEDSGLSNFILFTADCFWLWGFILLRRSQLKCTHNFWLRAQMDYRNCGLASAPSNSEFIHFCLKALGDMMKKDYRSSITHLNSAQEVAEGIEETGPAKSKLCGLLLARTLDKILD